MSKNFYVGLDKERIGTWCSMLCWSNADVSENEIFFYLKNKVFDCSFYISKKCDDGKALEKIVKTKDNDLVEEFSNNLAMKYLNYRDILILLEETEVYAFENGYKSAQKDIRKALGLIEW